MIQWSEPLIARALVRQTFHGKCVAVVPNCNWTGHECDLLCVADNLKIIDVEIKVTRADLKADADKAKWWHFVPWYQHRGEPRPAPIARDWPPKVWKHYYAMPADIWKPELLDSLPSKNSGVILLKPGGWPQPPAIASVERRATPNKDATPLDARAVNDIARLATLRLWDALEAARTSADEARTLRLAQRETAPA